MSVFNIKKDGAYQEPEAVKRKQDGAWIEAESAKRKQDGAWQEVWCLAKVLDVLQNTVSTGSASFSDDWESGLAYLTIKNEGGTIICAIDGDFTNPVIDFLLEGWFYHREVDRYISLGCAVYAYGVKTDGTVEETYNICGSSPLESLTQFSYTFSGDYKKVGLKIHFSDYNITAFEPLYYLTVRNVTIDGKKCVFDPDDKFNFD